ncbi:MAG: zinc-binding dehydrogenase [Clostridiales Family XIII bacterium]|jgi:threonine dehydrogenase-like Zn-dependent dehydrogenase|nr:zinc-binding dehydrogenase [Clostridiales Family XIII bacterium]
MKMKAGIFHGAGNVSVEEREVEHCGDNDAILQNLMASVCGTDISAYQHGGASYRIYDEGEFGHELVGRIVELGKNVTDLHVGQRVFPYPSTCAPNGAKACMLGGFSEYVHVADAKDGFNLFPIDDTITDEEASLIEPLTVGWHAAMRCKPKAEQNAIVLGAGGIGAAAALCLRAQGLEKILIVDRVAPKLNVMQELGFATANTSDEDWKNQIADYFGSARSILGHGVNAQIVVDAAGSGVLLDEIFPMIPIFGTLCIVAIYGKPHPMNLMAVTYGHLNIIGSGGQSPEDIYGVIEMLGSKQFDIKKLISGVYRQDDISKALDAAIDLNSVKICIDYR